MKYLILKYFRILIISNIIVATSLLLAYLCCFINPSTIWCIGLFGLAYIYLLAANLCFVVFWALSHKKIYILISIVTILIGWSFLERNVQLFEKKIPEEKLSESFKVLSFNVQGFEHRNTVLYDGKNLNIFDFFRNEDADILCMQEFVINRRRNIDTSYFSQQLNQMPFSHIELTRGSIGLATFSKNPIIHNELIYNDKTKNACMYSDIVIKNDTIRVYNIHLKSVSFSRRAVLSILRHLKEASLERAKQVEILNSHIKQSPYPVIICGDFNDPPTSYCYRKVRDNRKDAFIEAGSGRSTTISVGHVVSLRIDYIIHSEVFKAYDYESPRVHLSDHFPVMCRFVKK
jgi:endonuclease/exonuclease/phosphatase family metal-dependent hydrolase